MAQPDDLREIISNWPLKDVSDVVRKILVPPGFIVPENSVVSCSYSVNYMNQYESDIISQPSIGEQGNKRSIYAIGSLTKMLIAFCMFRLIEESETLHIDEKNPYKLLAGDRTWGRKAFDILSLLRRKNKRPRIEPSHNVNPNISELLRHMNGLPRIQRLLFTPDGEILMTKNAFEKILPSLKNDLKGDYYCYSNANYCLASLIITEATNMTLAQALQTIVLDHLDMDRTVLTRVDYEKKLEDGEIEEALYIGHDGIRSVKRPTFFDDDIHLACGGAYSCAEDICKLLRRILDNNGGWPYARLFGSANIPDDANNQKYGKTGSTILGVEAYLTRENSGYECIERDYTPKQSYELSAYKGEPLFAVFKSGSVLGYSSHYHLLREKDVIVVVLTNTTGGADLSSHISQYLLQTLFKLQPAVDFSAQGLIEHSRVIEKRRNTVEKEVGYEEISEEERTALAGIYEHKESAQQILLAPKDGALVARFLLGKKGAGAEVSGRSRPCGFVKYSDPHYYIVNGGTPLIDQYSMRFAITRSAFARNVGSITFNDAEYDGPGELCYRRTESIFA